MASMPNFTSFRTPACISGNRLTRILCGRSGYVFVRCSHTHCTKGHSEQYGAGIRDSTPAAASMLPNTGTAFSADHVMRELAVDRAGRFFEYIGRARCFRQLNRPRNSHGTVSSRSRSERRRQVDITNPVQDQNGSQMPRLLSQVCANRRPSVSSRCTDDAQLART